MNNLKSVLNTAVAQQDLPFAVAMVAHKGQVIFDHAGGQAAPGVAANQDTLFRIYSMSKAIGSFAALLLIDRGQLDLDTPVADILPDWNDLQVLEGFDGDTPILRAPKTVATIRHLATHAAGLSYEFWDANTRKFLKSTGHPPALSGTRAALNYPLSCDPGTGWSYGIAIDWLTLVIQAIDGRPIDQFCQEEIFDPLDMRSTFFEPDGQDHRLAQISARTPEGGFTPMDMAPPRKPETYGMGHALYSTAPDYLKFLRMVLNRGRVGDRSLIRDQTAQLMFDDLMQGVQVEKMMSVNPRLSADVDLFPGQRLTHSFGFVRNDADIPGRRRAGSLAWAGVCNSHYWIDPKTDLAAVLMTQSLPFAEPRFMSAYDRFERGVYHAL